MMPVLDDVATDISIQNVIVATTFVDIITQWTRNEFCINEHFTLSWNKPASIDAANPTPPV